MNAINEISQWTCDIRHKPGKDLIVPDLLSRPSGIPVGSAYTVQGDELPPDPAYVPPAATLAALEEVALNVVSPSSIAEGQKKCPDVLNHKKETLLSENL